ncbi:MAG: type I glyceraldehyde-3-phosphate dehydrogenase [Gemmatimonadales bacterium]|nr:MAG: type I glyceraldehyde-3-phosphate dehydrogenase [Gemmatimonadales bacterium]
MAIRVAINGFGRIGRLVLRSAIESGRDDLEFVAVNDLTDNETLAHLFEFDSVHGTWSGSVEAHGDGIRINGKQVRVLAERDPAQLPWKEMNVDVVIECTGRFTERSAAAAHLEAGARKVIISAPGKNEDITIVLGVNEDRYDPQAHDVISNASCTTNCLAPVVKVLHDAFGFEQGLMTTIHAYTNDQSILDAPHKDLRRARAAAMSMIPTTTGAARATSLVLPEMKGRIDGMAIRVPTPDVSIVDLTCTVGKDITVESVNEAFEAAASGPLKGIIGVESRPLVSVDFTGDSRSSIVDAGSTAVTGKRMVKVLAWYDNEWGYSCRVVDLVRLVGEKLPARSEG